MIMEAEQLFREVYSRLYETYEMLMQIWEFQMTLWVRVRDTFVFPKLTNDPNRRLSIGEEIRERTQSIAWLVRQEG